MRRNRFAVFLVFIIAGLTIAMPAHARPLGYTLAPGDTLSYLAGNSVVDIEYDTVLGIPVVWVGTGSGASVSTDMGISWRTFTASEGLNANSVSALHLQGDSVWTGMAHSQLFQDDLFPTGDGFSYSTDGGNMWDSSTPPQSTGIGFFSQQVFGMLPFDIASDPYGIWSSVFFGGLIRSIDGGQNWFSVYPADSSRLDFENKNYRDLGNRFFSVVSRSTSASGDTAEVYAGSAGGINRFLLIDARLKLASGPVWSINTDVNGSFDWIAGGDGITRLSRDPIPVAQSYFDSTTAGVPTGMVRASASPVSFALGSQTFVSVFDTVGSDTVGAGLAFTNDEGATWTTRSNSEFMGSGNGGYDLLYTTSAFWVAAGDSGLQRSVDNGANWQRVYVDTLLTSTALPQNRVLSVAHDSFADQLYVGTADGIFRLTLGGGDVVTGWEPVLYDGGTLADTVGLEIRSIAAFRNGTNELRVFAAAHADTSVAGSRFATLFSRDSGAVWQVANLDLVAMEYAYHLDTAFAATTGGLLIMPVTGTTITDTTVRVFQLADSLEFRSPFRSIVNMGGTELWLGGDAGYARRIGAGPGPGSFNWNLFKSVPRDSVDKIEVFSHADGNDTTISGNFVTALHLQDNGGQRTVWASTRPVQPPQTTGVSRSTDRGKTWFVSLPDRITWNFASFGPHVWAATSDGLYHTTNAGSTWVETPIIDAANALEFLPGVEVLSVAQLDDTTILAGSDDGIARSTDLGSSWTIRRSFVGVQSVAAGGTEVKVYASPVPYSPVNSSPLRIHYKPEQSGPVSIDIFDFAMQKVATVISGQQRAALPGPDPFGTNHYVEQWNAFNDQGERVATGVYFFRVEMGNSTEWGKLVILP